MDWSSLQAALKLSTLTGAGVCISHAGMSSEDGVIRSPGTIQYFVIFLTSRIAKEESCVSMLDILKS